MLVSGKKENSWKRPQSTDMDAAAQEETAPDADRRRSERRRMDGRVKGVRVLGLYYLQDQGLGVG